ncbi:Lipid kinase YegS [Serratia fonticola]|uniref:Lipid kinase YegS n=1 Tax=Serratia fonticola TaxID=47917 RepID=A0A4U9WIK1_SERFO|nr:Lipid kinase YegS [Serratia fonticola]
MIAGGGDGTINEVAAALAQLPAEFRPILGILPLGTANDFATACSIPLQPDLALQLAIKGRAYRSIWPRSMTNAISSIWRPAALAPASPPKPRKN